MGKTLKSKLFRVINEFRRRLVYDLPSRIPAKCPAPARTSQTADRRQ
jgi:hypothetical protein